MGSICAPNYANLYMGFFEKNFILTPEKNKYYPKLLTYYRHIDDIFGIFQGDAEELNDFVHLLNAFKNNLQFTCEFSNEKVHFLDMWVMKNNGKLSTSLFCKETDRNTLLLASSAHPTPLKKGLPKSQFFRLRRICQTTEDFVKKSADMKLKFISRGYPPDWVEQGYQSVCIREITLRSAKQESKER